MDNTQLITFERLASGSAALQFWNQNAWVQILTLALVSYIEVSYILHMSRLLSVS